jgi:hypothetical protein
MNENHFDPNQPRAKDGKWAKIDALNISKEAKDKMIKNIIDEENNQTDEDIVKNFPKELILIEKQTGLKFTKSDVSNSWYNNEKHIRLSDHSSMFAEKQAAIHKIKIQDSLDLNYKHYSPEAIIHLINKTDPFKKYKKGYKIKHSATIVGMTTYISSDYKNEGSL